MLNGGSQGQGWGDGSSHPGTSLYPAGAVRSFQELRQSQPQPEQQLRSLCVKKDAAVAGGRENAADPEILPEI